MSVPAGMALGLLLPFLTMDSSAPLTAEMIEDRKSQLSNASLIWAIVFTILLILCVVPHVKKPTAGIK
jgi:hypothetical protein